MRDRFDVALKLAGTVRRGRNDDWAVARRRALAHRCKSVYTALTVLVLWTVPASAQAQIERLSVAVPGITCNLCAINVENALRRIEGVAAVQVSLPLQRAEIRATEGGFFRLVDVRRELSRIGFTMGEVLDANAAGTVGRKGDGLTIAVPDMGTLAIDRASTPDVALFVGERVRIVGTLTRSGAEAVVRVQQVLRARVVR